MRLTRKTYFGFHKQVYLEVLASQRPQVLNFSSAGTTAYKAYFNDPKAYSDDDPVYVSQGLRNCHFGGLFLRRANILPAAAMAFIQPQRH